MDWNTYEQSILNGTQAPEKEKQDKVQQVNMKDSRRQMSPEARRREIAKLEKLITEKEMELESMRELRFEPEYYQDYTKMNALNEDIDDIHNEIAHLEEKWEQLLEEE